MNDPIQLKLINAVQEYERVFAIELDSFKRGMSAKRELQRDKFSTVKNGGTIERAILEYPETLFVIIRKQLNDKEWEYFDSKEGTRWFARKFPQYRLAEVV